MKKEQWITAVSERSPCGDDLEYDDDFLALGRAVLGTPEQQYGNTVIAAEKPDWREVERIADSLTGRTKDIRVCVLLTRGITQNYGLPGLAAGLEVIDSLLNQYWDEVHPRLVMEGEDDPYVRINAIAELADVSGLMRDVRHAVLIKSNLGSISVKDAEAALEGGPSEAGVSRQQLLAIAADAHREAQPALLAVGDAHAALVRINALCKERFGSDHAPDLLNLSTLLSRLMLLFPGSATATGGAHEIAADDAADASPGASPGANPGVGQTRGGAAIGQINSRQDVIRLLDLACRYLEENEPTNPAPLLIKRAQRLMTLDFMSIMRDMSPDSINQIEMIAGIRHD